MRAFYVFVTGTVVFMIAGLIASLLFEKAHLLLWFHNWRHPVADYYFFYVTRLGEEYGFIFFGILLWITSWRKMLTIPVLGITVSLISYLLKEFFQHERPSLYLGRMNWEGPMSIMGYRMISGYHSFPSGHSMAAWALFTLMAVHIRKTWFSILCLFLAVSVSLSRVYLMVHFLRDVVAGAMIGFALGYGVYYAYTRWMKNNLAKLPKNEAQPGQELNPQA